MVKCSKCNNFSDDNMQVCRFCGTPLYETSNPVNNESNQNKQPAAPQMTVAQSIFDVKDSTITNEIDTNQTIQMSNVTPGMQVNNVFEHKPSTPMQNVEIENKKKNSSPIVIIICVILIALIIAGVIYFLNKDKEDSNGNRVSMIKIRNDRSVNINNTNEYNTNIAFASIDSKGQANLY